MKKKNTAVIILAAGKGERMKSSLPKVLHEVCGRPMCGYVFDLCKDLRLNTCVTVLGYKSEEVKKNLPSGMKTVIQKKQAGTADAVKQALPLLKNFSGTVLVLYADNPLLTKDTVRKLLDRHHQNNAALTVLTAALNKPAGYGRIIRDKYSCICGIVEEKEANDFQKDIKEINTGVMCFDKNRLSEALKSVRPSAVKKEYYLTDCIEILYKKGMLIENIQISDIKEALGINTRADLSTANRIMQLRLNEGFMKKAVTIIDPTTVFISFDAKIGEDTIIYPFTVIEKNVKIGKRCSVGPFAHLRGGTVISDEVKVGNFIEIVRSKLAPHTLAKHFGYIGDTHIGRSVNIGAGVVTANFDGAKKNTTVIDERAFIGSDTVLVAPVKIGKNAKTGAGSVVTKNRNVPSGKTVAGVPAELLGSRKK